MSFDTHQGHKSTIPRRPRSSHGVPRNKKRAATIWGFMDKATQGMAAAHEIIELLEKDNTIFGQYLANEAERERAADEAAAAEAAERARASRPDSDAAARRARAAVASGDESYEVLQALDAGRQSGTGLTKTQLLRLPTCRATSGTCSICLEEFAQDGATAVLRLPRCGHVFHAACCGRWFGTRDACPLCRAPVVADGIR